MNYEIIRPPLHENFYLPGRDELLKLKSGDLVKVTFQVGGETPERMWVRLIDTSDDSEWIGALDNEPMGEETQKVLKPDMEVSFHPLDIIQIFEDK